MSNRTKLPDGTRKTPARKLPAWARKDVEDAIERLLAVLNEADGDPDLEPSLGSSNPRYWHEGGPYTSQERWAEGPRDDTEDEHDGCEPPEDDEPTLGWTTSGAMGGDGYCSADESEDSLGSTNSIDQTNWSAGAGGDVEHEHDGREPDEDFEPSLGAPEHSGPRLLTPRGSYSAEGNVDQTCWALGFSDDTEYDPAELGIGDDA